MRRWHSREPSEQDFQEQVLGLAALYGWTAYHVPDSRRCTAKGFPDLVLLFPGCVVNGVHRPPQVLFRELKTSSGRLSKEQLRWIEVMSRAGLDADIWRPHDWARIVEILKGEA